MELFVRATVVYWFLWLVVRGTGKRSLAELTPLDMLLIVVLGDIVQQGVTQEDMSITGAVVAVSVFVGWTMLGDALSRREIGWSGARRVPCSHLARWRAPRRPPGAGANDTRRPEGGRSNGGLWRPRGTGVGDIGAG